MKLIITQDDIKVYRPTAALEDSRINPFILEAQIQDLRPVLNPALYHDFLNKFDDGEATEYAVYQDLLNGVEWEYEGNTEFFPGLKPMLAYYALARYVGQGQVHIGRSGLVQKSATAQSEVVDGNTLKYAVLDLKSSAMTYQNEVIKFLENNPTDYPLYSRGGASEDTGNRTSFNFFKA